MTTTTPTPLPQQMGIDSTGRTWTDASALGDWLKCPRRWYIKHVLRRTPSGRTPALDFGTAWHQVMETHHQGVVPVTPEQLISIGRANGLTETQDHRNQLMLEDAYAVFLKLDRIPYPPYLVDGKPIIEGAFALPLDDSTMYCGRIDRIVALTNGKPAVEDYKTSSANSAQFWGEFEASVAQTGYLWAATQARGELVDTFIIQGLFTLKSGITPKQLEERIFIRDYRVFDEWKAMVLSNTRRMAVLSRFGTTEVLTCGECCNRDACYSHKYGPCPFVAVCNMADPEARLPLLSGLGFTDYTWSPLA